ncbi:hypothetical protein HPB51_013421 [Rhipicephalus microplus]|uniref:Uncharacterized protein n=1 Tax=Rhipicephalus microplus TaxID=6941 RepID=A0A9J6D598_RHIMP|nr:hypothetical protein HPB51_013421 [Rhipicephalus microplus]
MTGVVAARREDLHPIRCSRRQVATMARCSFLPIGIPFVVCVVLAAFAVVCCGATTDCSAPRDLLSSTLGGGDHRWTEVLAASPTSVVSFKDMSHGLAPKVRNDPTSGVTTMRKRGPMPERVFGRQAASHACSPPDSLPASRNSPRCRTVTHALRPAPLHAVVGAVVRERQLATVTACLVESGLAKSSLARRRHPDRSREVVDTVAVQRPLLSSAAATEGVARCRVRAFLPAFIIIPRARVDVEKSGNSLRVRVTSQAGGLFVVGDVVVLVPRRNAAGWLQLGQGAVPALKLSGISIRIDDSRIDGRPGDVRAYVVKFGLEIRLTPLCVSRSTGETHSPFGAQSDRRGRRYEQLSRPSSKQRRVPVLQMRTLLSSLQAEAGTNGLGDSSGNGKAGVTGDRADGGAALL